MKPILLGAVLALCAGCASVGPFTVARDRVDDDHAITTSWKRTMLLNMVKLRYGDTPTFIDVSSIINSYTLEGQVSAGGSWTSQGGPAIVVSLIQASGAVGLRIESQGGRDFTVLVLHRNSQTPEIRNDVRTLPSSPWNTTATGSGSTRPITRRRASSRS